MIMLMTIKKVAREPKSRNDPRKSGPKKKATKMEPGWAARNRGAEGSQGAFMTRSRETELARGFFFFFFFFFL
jgi:hypothetical protein